MLSVVVFPADVVYVNRVVMHPADHYKIIKNLAENLSVSEKPSKPA